MGLDFIGSDVHFSYSGFMLFRQALAREIGINLDNMIGFGGNESWNTINDDIKDLLNHSDYDGELSSAQCKKIAPRLRELIKTWPNYSYMTQQALSLANDMEALAEDNKPLMFC